MALRSLLRKMPALRLGSPPTGPVRAAGYRLMSHGAPGQARITEEELARQQAEIDRMTADFYMGLGEMRGRRQVFSQLISADIAESERTKKKLKMMLMASNAVIILCVPATLYMLTFW